MATIQQISHWNPDAGSNVTQICDAACKLAYLTVNNVNEFNLWLMLFDAPKADVTEGTKPHLAIPIGGTADLYQGVPVYFEKACSYVITSSYEDFAYPENGRVCVVSALYQRGRFRE